MNNYRLAKDITLYTVAASKFPEGVELAFEALYKNAKTEDVVAYYGISHANASGEIMYRAAMELKESTIDIPELETYILQAGEYRGREIFNFRDCRGDIGNTFRELIQLPELDKNGCCVGMYHNNNDVRCMVRIEDSVDASKKH